MQFIKAGGYQLEYEWHGPSPHKASTIIFLHEGLGCVAMWRDFPRRVADATGFGVLVYSRAGYGASETVGLPRSVSFMHHEALTVLPQVLDTMRVQNAILFGHSDGGSIAIIHAGSGKADKVRGLILEAPHVFVEDLSIESIAKAKDNYENEGLKSGLERYHGNNVECAFRGWNDVWLNQEFRSWNIESYLPMIKVPMLLIQGDEDEYGTIRQVESIEEGSGGPVESILLGQCGHSPHRDEPQVVLDLVKNFLVRLRQ